MTVWIVLKEYNAWEDWNVEGVYATLDLAEKARRAFIREAVSEGARVCWNPDDEGNCESDNWQIDFNVVGPHEVEGL